MALKMTPVSRCLHRRLQIAGFEVFDILLVFVVLSVLQLMFGQTNQKLLLVWLPAALLAATLRIGKHGKPENYLVHWLKNQLSAKELGAFHEPDGWQDPPRLSRPGGELC